MSPSSGLEKLTVQPVSDLSSYPEVVVEASPPYCDCKLRDCLKSRATVWGPQYCDLHNCVILSGVYEEKDFEGNKVFETVVAIINHESLHWILYKIVGEQASDWLDTETVSDFLEAATS